MIVVDTSALVAFLMKEPLGAACMDRLETEREVAISAATMVESMIVATRRDFAAEMIGLLDSLMLTVIPVDEAFARRAAAAYARWGKGMDPARLNFGDCFSYAAAQDHACPLLYIGDDFARTDVMSAL